MSQLVAQLPTEGNKLHSSAMEMASSKDKIRIE